MGGEFFPDIVAVIIQKQTAQIQAFSSPPSPLTPQAKTAPTLHLNNISPDQLPAPLILIPPINQHHFILNELFGLPTAGHHLGPFQKLMKGDGSRENPDILYPFPHSLSHPPYLFQLPHFTAGLLKPPGWLRA